MMAIIGGIQHMVGRSNQLANGHKASNNIRANSQLAFAASCKILCKSHFCDPSLVQRTRQGIK